MSEPENIYAPPDAQTAPSGPAGRITGFAKGWVITDLVMSAIRFLLGFVSIAGLAGGALPEQLRATAGVEAILQFIIGACGVTAAILLLRGSRRGLLFGWIAVICVIPALALSIYQFTILAEQNTDETARMGMIIGGAFSLVVRLGLNIVYAVVLVRLSRPGLLR